MSFCNSSSTFAGSWLVFVIKLVPIMAIPKTTCGIIECSLRLNKIGEVAKKAPSKKSIARCILNEKILTKKNSKSVNREVNNSKSPVIMSSRQWMESSSKSKIKGEIESIKTNI